MLRNLRIKLTAAQVIAKTQMLYLEVLNLLLIFNKARVKSGKRKCLRKTRVQKARKLTSGEKIAKEKLSYSLAWWSGMKVVTVLNENMVNAWH